MDGRAVLHNHQVTSSDTALCLNKNALVVMLLTETVVIGASN